MTTQTPTITLRGLNLMGWSPERDHWIIENSGGNTSVTTFHWLKKHSQYFVSLLDCGRTYHSLPGHRLPKFRAYCAEQGVTILEKGAR